MTRLSQTATDPRHAFNTPVECGLRSVTLLMSAFPRTCDLQRLVQYDYLIVHSGDVADGPPSIHPASPHRSGELLVRRGLVRAGLDFMTGRRVIEQRFTSRGIEYVAGDFAVNFLEGLTAAYTLRLRERATWVVERFQELPNDKLADFMRAQWSQWGAEFALSHGNGES